MSCPAGASGGALRAEVIGPQTGPDQVLDGPVVDQASPARLTPTECDLQAVGKAVSEWIPLLLGASPEDVVAALATPPALTGEAIAAVHQFLYTGKAKKGRYGVDNTGRERTASRALYHCLLAMDAELPPLSDLTPEEANNFARRVGKLFQPYTSEKNSIVKNQGRSEACLASAATRLAAFIEARAAPVGNELDSCLPKRLRPPADAASPATDGQGRQRPVAGLRVSKAFGHGWPIDAHYKEIVDARRDNPRHDHDGWTDGQPGADEAAT